MNSYKALSDNELLHLLRQDDGRALSALYLRYWDRLLSVACHRFNDPEVAEEVVQDVFFSLWERRAALDIKYTLATYLSIAVKYKIINVMDKRYRLRSKASRVILLEPVAPSSEELLFEKELWGRIEASVKQLPEKCQLVFSLSRMEGKSNKEIATELDISEKTVEAHMSKALKMIRGDLSKIAPVLFACLFATNL